MYLKSLTLRGFKSFANKTTLDFEPGMTCIVGPNGSGKSNISDAILWVLGERSAKNIRGEAMNDVIFSGAKNKKRASMAEVSLCLDNSDSTLDIDYNEVVITRRMYATGESDYLLNDTPVRRLDIVNILHDSGLGSGTNSIISQGSLDSVLSLDGLELKSLVEESAGILKQKQKKEKSLAKLENIQANFEKISAVVAEVERQLEPLRRRAKRARTYLEIKDDYAQTSLQIAVDDIKRAMATKGEIERQSSSLQTSINEQEQVIANCEAQINELSEKIKKINEENSLFSSNLEKSTSIVTKLDSLILLIENEISRANTSIADGNSSRLEINSKLDEHKSAYENLQAELKVLQENIANIGSKKDELKVVKDEIEETFNSLNVNVGKSDEDVAIARSNLASKKDELLALTSSVEVAKTKILLAEQQRQENLAKVEEENNFVHSLEAEVAEAQTKFDDTSKFFDELSDTLSKQSSEKDEIDAQLSRAKAELEANKAKLTALQEILESLNDGSDDALELAEVKQCKHVVDGISVESEYDTIVETLLGTYNHSILVDGANSLSGLHKKIEEVGSEQTLSILVDEERTNELPLLFLNRLVDHIKVEDYAANAIENLLGDVYVCDTFDEALKLSKDFENFRFVTKAGDFIGNRGEVMLRAVNANSSTGVFEKKREVAQLQEDVRECDAKVEELSKKFESVLVAHSEAQQKAEAQREALSEAKINLQAKKSIYDRHVEEVMNLQTSLDSSTTDLEEAKAIADGSGEKISAMKAEIEALETLINSSVAGAADAKSKLADVQAKKDSWQLDYTKLVGEEAKLASSRDVLVQKIDFTQAQIDEANARLVVLENSKAQSLLVVNALSPMRDKYSKLLDFAVDFQSNFANTNSGDAHEDLFENSKNLRDAASAAHVEKDRLVSKLSELRVDETKNQIEYERLKTFITEKCNKSLDEALALPELTNRDEVKANLDALERKMARVGNVDLDSLQEYEDLQERYEFLTSNLEDIKASITAIKKIDTLIKERFREQFEQTFEKVNANFTQTFEDLFPGGTGQLELSDPENIDEAGVIIKANPAGKKIRKISLMSGGEKSLVALSFLFAIYAARKAPFYILDEVEAALDDTNLVRMLDYVNNMRSSVQFIFITHQRRTMEMADVLFGVSMQEDGVTKVISQRLDAVDAQGE